MFNKEKEIKTMEDVIACMKEIKEKYPINEKVQNTTFNDIAKLDKDVTVLAYLDMVNKIEEAIEDKNDELIAKMDSCLGHGGDNQWQIK